MSWMRRSDDEADKTEKEWISDLLEPLQAADLPISEDDPPPDSATSEPSTRSVAQIIDELDQTPLPHAPHHGPQQVAPPADSEITAEIPAVTSVPVVATIAPPDVGLNAALAEALAVEGAVAVAVVNCATGRITASRSTAQSGDATGHSPWRDAGTLGLDEDVEEMFITLRTQYHMMRAISLDRAPRQFFYLVLDRKVANLAMARHQLGQIVSRLSADQSTNAE